MKLFSVIILSLFIFGTMSGCANKAQSFTALKDSKWKILTEDSHSHSIGFSNIVFFDSNNGLGLRLFSLLKTTDGGKTWKDSFEGDLAAYSMVFTDKENGWMVGTENRFASRKDDVASNEKNKPLILKTQNKGENWSKISINEDELPRNEKRFSLFYNLCVDKNGMIWIVGDKGLIQGKIENKKLKVLNVYSTEGTLYSVACGENGDVWAVGTDGQIIKYRKDFEKKNIGNEKFFKKAEDYSASFYKVKIVNNKIWLVGAFRQSLVKENEELDLRALVFRSHDDGQTWENKTPDLEEAFYDIHFEGKNGWLVGANGSIYHTFDSGNVWRRQESPTKNSLSNIFFLDSENIWISGDKATILKFSN